MRACGEGAQLALHMQKVFSESLGEGATKSPILQMEDNLLQLASYGQAVTEGILYTIPFLMKYEEDSIVYVRYIKTLYTKLAKWISSTRA